ncbi:hypothetical protein L7F22_005915 [Adiantum nelumboides]|nr:hypothetical protein [Adiantum nelumboides]
MEEEDVHRTDSMISRATSTDKVTPREKKSPLFPQCSLPLGGSLSGSVGSTAVGGGWKLVWQWDRGLKGQKEKAGQGEFRKVYLHQESRDGGDSRINSTHSLPCFGSSASNLDPIQAAALVSGRSRRASLENQVGSALIHPAESARKGLACSELLEGGVKQALIVGVLLQALEQFDGINGVLNYTPTILEESSAEVLLSGFGITSDSVSLLSSAAMELICLPYEEDVKLPYQEVKTTKTKSVKNGGPGLEKVDVMDAEDQASMERVERVLRGLDFQWRKGSVERQEGTALEERRLLKIGELLE